jgi:hypothetical protein
MYRNITVGQAFFLTSFRRRTFKLGGDEIGKELSIKAGTDEQDAYSERVGSEG